VSHYPVYPAGLGQGEFARVRFTLEMLSACRLDAGTLLGLRRPLQLAAGAVLGPRGALLFDPPPDTDPLARRRHQKPTPGFVLHAAAGGAQELLEGDRLHFELLLLGTAVQSFTDLASCLAQVGRHGLVHGDGCFEIAAVELSNVAGGWQRPGPLARVGSLVPELTRLDHWLDDHWPARAPLALDFISPLRLVADGRVLRRPRFDQLFPFLLRRVTSMLHAWCGLELGEDPAPLLQAARTCTSRWDAAGWLDWRETGRQEPLGGLLGTLHVDGQELDRILWVVLLATLFGVGKGAAYGAGRCRLLAA
jgi:hypothetical protein